MDSNWDASATQPKLECLSFARIYRPGWPLNLGFILFSWLTDFGKALCILFQVRFSVVVFRWYDPGNWLTQQVLREITLSVPNQDWKGEHPLWSTLSLPTDHYRITTVQWRCTKRPSLKNQCGRKFLAYKSWDNSFLARLSKVCPIASGYAHVFSLFHHSTNTKAYQTLRCHRRPQNRAVMFVHGI